MTPYAWTQLGMFWATVGLVLIAVIAAAFSYLTMRAAVDPHVIVYAKADQSRPHVIVIVIENIGGRVAKKVRFAPSEPIPNRIAGGHGWSAPGAGPMLNGPIVSGIPALAPRERREMIWGVYPTLHTLVGDRQIEIVTRFESDPLLGFGDTTDHEVTSILEIGSFWETDAVDPDGARQSAHELKRIADVVEKRARL